MKRPRRQAVWLHHSKHKDTIAQIERLRISMAVETGKPMTQGDVVAALVEAKTKQGRGVRP